MAFDKCKMLFDQNKTLTAFKRRVDFTDAIFPRL